MDTMTAELDTRALLAEAFRREGIAYPSERLAAAEADFADLRLFLDRMRAEAKEIRTREL